MYYSELINQIYFDYETKEDPYDYVIEKAEDMVNYEIYDLLTQSNTYKEFKGDEIVKYFNKLTINNMNIYLSSKSYKNECDLIEPWYQTKYKKENYKERIEEIFNSIEVEKNLPLKELNGKAEIDDLDKNMNISLSHQSTSQSIENKSSFLYPCHNEYIPLQQDLIIKTQGAKNEYPVILFSNNRNVLYFKQDFTFLQPKVIIIFQIYQTESKFNFVKEEVLYCLWEAIVYYELRQFIYKADEAGVALVLKNDSKGVYIEVSGLSPHIKKVLIEFLHKWKAIKFEEKYKEFVTQKEILTKTYKNFSFWKAYDVAEDLLDTFNVVPCSSYPQRLYQLQNEVTFDDFLSFVKESVGDKLERTNYIEILAQGNITEDEIKDISKECLTILQKENNKAIDHSNFLSYKHINIPCKANYYYIHNSEDLTSDNSAILSYFQLGHLDDRNKCLIYLIINIFSEDFFDELRTNQQLGYNVTLSSHLICQIESITFSVQSTEKSPEYILKKINEFIYDGIDVLVEMEDETFVEYKDSVINDLMQKDLIFYDEAYRNLNEIKKRTYVYNRREIKIKLLESITKEDVLEFYKENLIKNFKRFDIEILAEKHKDENKKNEESNTKSIKNKTGTQRVKVASFVEYKRKLGLYKDYLFM